MTVLVTGSGGFIGAHVVNELLARGDQVVGYDLSPPPSYTSELPATGPADRLVHVRGDILDVAALFRAIHINKVDRLVHLAYLLVPDSQANPSRALAVNCQGTLNVLEAARTFSLSKVVWASSMAVFGHLTPGENAHRAIRDDSPHRPDNIYGACKSFNEHVAEQYNQHYDIDSLGIRVNLVYGPGKVRGEGLFTAALIDRPAVGLPGHVPYGDDVFEWQYVRDVARAFALAVHSAPAPLAVHNLAGTVASVSDAAAIMRTLAPQSSITLQPGTIGFACGVDGSALSDHLRYRPKYSLEDGLRETVRAIQEHRKS